VVSNTPAQVVAIGGAALSTVMEIAIRADQAVIKEIRDVFDRPTPVVQKGVRWSASTKHNLTAKISLASGGGSGVDVSSVLAPNIKGGNRIVKASERRLRRFGFMAENQWVVPGPGAPLDRYGNISAANMKKILNQVSAFQEAGYNKTKKRRSRIIGTLYFIPRVGIFRRTGTNSSIPVLFFTDRAPQYEAGRFDFEFVVKDHVQKNFSKNFESAWNYAVKTAR